jgi:hypothetical protein
MTHVTSPQGEKLAVPLRAEQIIVLLRERSPEITDEFNSCRLIFSNVFNLTHVI